MARFADFAAVVLPLHAATREARRVLKAKPTTTAPGVAFEMVAKIHVLEGE
jgi:hypothetical protein